MTYTCRAEGLVKRHGKTTAPAGVDVELNPVADATAAASGLMLGAPSH
ncbi:hypothetical protein [Catellatospora sp. NPDC049133]|jgi:hypothetical protein